MTLGPKFVGRPLVNRPWPVLPGDKRQPCPRVRLVNRSQRADASSSAGQVPIREHELSNQGLQQLCGVVGPELSQRIHEISRAGWSGIRLERLAQHRSYVDECGDGGQLDDRCEFLPPRLGREPPHHAGRRISKLRHLGEHHTLQAVNRTTASSSRPAS